LTPAEVYNLASQTMPGLTETTVYRTLEFLAENGFALAAHTGSGSGKLVYEVSGHDHHHVICRGCAAEMEIPHEQLTDLYKQIEQATGYRLTTSHITFSGLCPHCQ
jgi:Fe2+ or Zn2+ uptake regulation protein